jgi:hypothetical protein
LPAPGFTALAISSLEFFGGILLALGLFSRVISLVLTINMLMAYITADREALVSIFSDPDKFTAAAPYVFLVASIIVLLFGPGFFSAAEHLTETHFRKAATAERGLRGDPRVTLSLRINLADSDPDARLSFSTSTAPLSFAQTENSAGAFLIPNTLAPFDAL